MNQQQKLEKLLTTAGMGNIDFEGKIVAIKLHFGEVGNLAYLRPNYAKTVADFVKARGGRPFLTDCNTLYIGSRKNALEHMDAAYLNGFSPFSTGCHVIIADGLRGGDDVEVPVVGGEYVKYAKIGRAPHGRGHRHLPHALQGGMSRRATAARSRTSAWAAARARARWKCTQRASPM